MERTTRLNSLLKEVISEVIKNDVKNPHVSDLTTVTRVDITKDLHHAKVYVSIIGDEKARALTMDALQSASSFIAVSASKKVTMYYFPELKFIYDDGVEQHMRIEELLHEVNNERQAREAGSDDAAGLESEEDTRDA